MSKCLVAVRMPVELMREIDARTENRSALIVRAIEAYLLGAKAEPEKMIIETPKRDRPATGQKRVDNGPERPGHSATCRCTLCQMKHRVTP